MSGVFVNERYQLSTTEQRCEAADKAYPGILEQLCGPSGKHTFPSKPFGRGKDQKMWTLTDALTRTASIKGGTVYRHFKTTQAYARNTLNPNPNPTPTPTPTPNPNPNHSGIRQEHPQPALRSPLREGCRWAAGASIRLANPNPNPNPNPMTEV
jgi:hypothetical protein